MSGPKCRVSEISRQENIAAPILRTEFTTRRVREEIRRLNIFPFRIRREFRMHRDACAILLKN